MSAIHIQNLKIYYQANNFRKQSPVLNVSTINIHKGKIVGLYGPNHVGKSTLLKYISQIHSEYYVVDDHTHYNGKSYDRKANTPFILYVPQDFNSSILPWFNVDKNIKILMEGLKVPDSDIEQKIHAFCLDFGFESKTKLYEHYGFLKSSSEQKGCEIKSVMELSGGQKQILSILRALITKPDIITMDEPFSAIDNFQRGTEFRKSVFKYLRNNRITTVFVSHELEEMEDFVDEILVFERHVNGSRLMEKRDKADTFNALKAMN